MQIEIIEQTPEILADYEKVSIAFRVESFFRVELLDKGLSGVSLREERMATPFEKDYDSISEERPSRLGERFDLSNWGVMSAFDGAKRVGGAVLAWNTPNVQMLEGREDLACLWDLRVAPEYRGEKIGHRLLDRAVTWAKQRNCRRLKVETQNINIPACRFYARQGCELGAINRYAYPAWMNEVQLIWYREL